MYFAGRTRYIVLALSLACLTLIFSNSLALNFTIICMDDVKTDFYSENKNTTEVHWLDSSKHKNSLFSAIAIGCILGTVPNSLLIQKFGLRAAVAVSGLLTTVATLSFPLAVKYGFAAVFIMRVLQGVGTALSFPMTGIAPAQWSTLKATGTFIAILSCHVQ
ncbi:unnamed protein product, partial [Cylicostephanus goldi]